MHRQWFLAFLLLALAVAPGCTVPTDCTLDEDQKTCVALPTDPGIAPAARLAPSMDGMLKCKASSDCIRASTPICDPSGTCVSCDTITPIATADGLCADKKDANKWCITDGANKGQCGICRINEHCTASAPICTQGSCGPCTKHKDCSSGVCILPEYGGSGIGTCADPKDISAVEKVGDLIPALGTQVSKRFVLVKTLATYPQVTLTLPEGVYERIIVGPGRDVGAEIAGISVSATSNPNTNKRLVIDGVTLSGGVVCGTPDVTLELYRVTVNKGNDAVTAATCKAVTIQASRLTGATNNGIFLGGSVNFSISNSLIDRNGTGLYLQGGSGQVLLSTVINNNVAVRCFGPAPIRSSIIYRNNAVGKGQILGDGSCIPRLESVALGDMMADPAVKDDILGLPPLADETGTGNVPEAFKLTAPFPSTARIMAPSPPSADYFGVKRGTRNPGTTDIGFAEFVP